MPKKPAKKPPAKKPTTKKVAAEKPKPAVKKPAGKKAAGTVKVKTAKTTRRAAAATISIEEAFDRVVECLKAQKVPKKNIIGNATLDDLGAKPKSLAECLNGFGLQPPLSSLDLTTETTVGQVSLLVRQRSATKKQAPKVRRAAQAKAIPIQDAFNRVVKCLEAQGVPPINIIGSATLDDLGVKPKALADCLDLNPPLTSNDLKETATVGQIALIVSQRA